MTKYKKSFGKYVSKTQKTQDAYKFRREITEITSSINSRVRLWKITTLVPDVVFMNFTSGIFSSKHSCLYNKYIYYIDMSVLLGNIPLVKFINATSGTRVVYFP